MPKFLKLSVIISDPEAKKPLYQFEHFNPAHIIRARPSVMHKGQTDLHITGCGVVTIRYLPDSFAGKVESFDENFE